jgi:hypothetical protein
MPSDYSGHVPDPHLRAVPDFATAFADAVAHPPIAKSPINKLIDDMLRKTTEAREEILKNLVQNPGVVATYGDDFVVIFDDVEIRTLDSESDRYLNTYSLEIVQKWTIRRREEVDGTSLG